MTASLPTRPLDGTGMDITRVGFGAWAIGGGGWSFAWGDQDDEASIAAIRHAVEQGINWIDTAAVYGLGHSEEVVARALERIPEADRPYVFSKCGLRWDPDNPRADAHRIASPDSIRYEVEQSCKRLDVERIDLYQVHWPPDDGTPIEDYWATMLELKDEGKIRAAGLSNHHRAQLEVAHGVGPINSLQPPFSAIKRRAATEIAWCADHDTGVIVYSPMQAGLLTGSFSTERAAGLGDDDWRSRDPEFSGDRLRRNLALADGLRPVAEQRGISVAAVAVAWTLAWRGVTGAIVGARSPEQVDGWLPAGDIELSDAELGAIAHAIQSTGAGEGPAHPRRPSPS